MQRWRADMHGAGLSSDVSLAEIQRPPIEFASR